MESDIFLELCKLSEKHKWCANIGCTTCGHFKYKYAFIAIINGLIVDDLKKLGNQGNENIRDKYKDRIRNFKLNRDESLVLAKIIASTNIGVVHETIQNQERWLKVLGLILVHIRNDKEALNLLSDALIYQLNNLVQKQLLIDILTVEDLATINLEIKYNKRLS